MQRKTRLYPLQTAPAQVNAYERIQRASPSTTMISESQQLTYPSYAPPAVAA
jgi:hypothetical protein